ncbi:hypothetical protein FEQ05_03963 [Burkholderia pseudomultivorans]|uniref:Uncharacterized protein n=1 Tax=Burkholderia pseudomultivorans TaxID=1207504 RepID=A0A6P2LL05_9BURK|nr:hypothetical protein [Burkholderia pseudomultivorans]MDR8738090.1 hypothetical protein [Burkholderia pseudomultivorans]MDR8744737.1 hypothetical protein [Burkholderia pseudomultivorans]MDR8756618.1 hypothetical protein [Burkholderia pseudomultivorans]MDR8780808.1 hypothetical protein [Burkholderia pseudomultivorans]
MRRAAAKAHDGVAPMPDLQTSSDHHDILELIVAY